MIFSGWLAADLGGTVGYGRRGDGLARPDLGKVLNLAVFGLYLYLFVAHNCVIGQWNLLGR